MAFSLPPPVELARRARLVAFLDTLLEPEFSLRYFDFNPKFARGERLFSVRSGEGDHAFAWFGAAGTLVRGKHSEKKAVADRQLFEGLPPTLHAAKKEPAFQLRGDSFATWCPKGTSGWQSAVNPLKGGLGELLEVLDGNPKSFARYAASYHEVKLNLPALGALYRASAVTPGLVARLSDRFDVRQAFAAAKELGLPVSGKPPASKKTSGARPQADDVLGDAEFKVAGSRDATMLVVGGRVQLKAPGKDLYYQVIEQVRATLRAAGGKAPG